jgi:hypothetical protein
VEVVIGGILVKMTKKLQMLSKEPKCFEPLDSNPSENPLRLGRPSHLPLAGEELLFAR